MADSARQIDEWLQSPLGESLLQAETEALGPFMSQFFGFHLLQIGAWGDFGTLRASALTRQSLLVSARPGQDVQIVSRASQLAVASDSVDGIILPHTLEFDRDPHQVLRETARVLTGEGKIAILGFNPYGFWGARRMLGTRSYLPGLRHMISRRRICDWLNLLGMELMETRHLFYRAPINSRMLLERGAGYERVGRRLGGFLSGVYLVMAKKCVYSPLRPRGLRPRKKAAVVGGLVEPTSRNSS